MKNKIWSFLLFIFGEMLIIFSFIYFGKNLNENVLYLNIAVSTIIYALFFLDLLVPWVSFSDESQKKIGSLGLRWFFTFLYIASAIGGMIFFNLRKPPLDFTAQIIIHGILLFVLFLGFFLSDIAGKNVQKVYQQEQQNRIGIDEMRRAFSSFKSKIYLQKNIPDEVKTEIENLEQQLRFVSPNNTSEANVLENNFLNETKNLENLCQGSHINVQEIKDSLKQAHFILSQRKAVFSK